MSGDLHMLRMRFDLPKLYELGRRRRLPLREADVGYLLHCALKELFGADAPGPFAAQPARGRAVTVLAYSSRTKLDLQNHAHAFAEPSVHAVCDFASFDEKRMPGSWAAGRRLGFDVRACPVVRMSSDGTAGPGGPTWRKGAEVDAFLARCWRSDGEPIDRGEVYRGWLASELERRGGARLVRAEVKAFQRERLVRREHGESRGARALERPDVSFTGELEVTTPADFAALLARGVGRHRAFGFGMLLLRPPG
jgi:CRISPR system Cascade subunit CasE